MDSKRLKQIDVVLDASNDKFTVQIKRMVDSPLYIASAKAFVLERFNRSFPELDAIVKIVRVYE